MKQTLLATALLGALAAASSVQAAPFGIYDPRSLAMGGVGVTTATARNANFFNPAALAAAKDDEHFAFGLPIASARASDQDKLLDDIDALDSAGQSLSDALAAFDANPTLGANGTAAAAGQELTRFNNELTKVNNKVLDAGLFAGTLITVPSKKVGFGIHLSGRADLGAKFDYQASDQTTISNLGANLSTCAAGSDPTAPACQAAQTATTDGDINGLTSNVKLQGLAVTEVGLAFASRIVEWGNIDVGLTPKMQKFKTFDYQVTAQSTDDIDLNTGIKEESGFNFDVGVTKTYNDSMKAGLVIKNAIGKEFTTVLGKKIEMKPQARLGVSHHTSWSTLGLDLDLTRNAPIALGFDKETKFLGVGAELDAWLVQFRFGYRHDLTGNYDGMASAGLGLNLFGLHLDAAVAGNDKEKAASVQVGLNF